MKKHMKAFLAVTLALTLCTATTGCGAKNEESETQKTSNSADIKDSTAETTSMTETTSEAPASEKTGYTPKQEILDADFNSGLIQIGDDVFNCSEHITVAEMIEKYSDKYDITTVGGGNIDESPWMLEAPKFANNNSNEIYYSYDFNCMLVLRPKNAETKYTVYATIANFSEEKEIKYSDATVVFYEAGNLEITGDIDTDSPSWAPMGFGNRYTKDLQRVNKGYDRASLSDYLKTKGYTYIQDEGIFVNQILPDVLNCKGLVFGGKDELSNEISLYVIGETSPNGYSKVYYFTFHIDENTNKIGETNTGFWFVKN